MKINIYIVILLTLFTVNCASDDIEQQSIPPVKEEEKEEEEVNEPIEETWMTLAIPADPGEGMTWEFQEAPSDDFEYLAPAENKGNVFLNKWDDFYHNAWTGPGLTVWKRNNSLVKDGLLQLPSNRASNGKDINAGCITSTNRVVYPVYIEVSAKVMNSTLSSGVWLLSPDDTQEIDILEAYGSSYSESAQKDHSWFAERIHISHHVFVRDPFLDYQPTDPGSWYNDGTVWREDFHRYGVYWRDPWHLEYYIDGELVRTVSGENLIDPNHYTNTVDPGNTQSDTRSGLSKEMDIIIDVEDQDWRSAPASGLDADTYTPTDSELSNADDHTFKVEWIRIYKPVSK